MPVNNDLASETWLRYVECRDNGHLDFLAKAEKCDAFAIGKQWAQEDLDALKLARRPALTINKILSTLSTILGDAPYLLGERPSSHDATVFAFCEGLLGFPYDGGLRPHAQSKANLVAYRARMRARYFPELGAA